MHSIDVNILKCDKKKCKACGEKPKAGNPDGIFKIPRYHKNQNGYLLFVIMIMRFQSSLLQCKAQEYLYFLLASCHNSSTCFFFRGADVSLMEDYVLADDQDVKEHIKYIDSKIAPDRVKDCCGASEFKAATSESSKSSKHDETGMIVACCRHGVVLCACNMHKGETYRHIHFIHKLLHQMNCKFLCYDVICQYWHWAQKVGQQLPEFAKMTEDMKPLLPRLHAYAHVWYCLVSICGIIIKIVRCYNYLLT